MPAADFAAFRLQHVPQHPAARERMLEVQLVDAAHQSEISVRGRPGQIVNAAPADPERLRLPGERQFMGPVDHRLALASSPALPSAPAKKSLASVNSPIFACRTLTSTAGAASALAPSPKTAVAPSRELAAPLRDLVRMHVELPGKLRPASSHP